MPKVVPADQKKDHKFMLRMNSYEFNSLKEYCIKNNIAISDLFRTALNDYLEKHSIRLEKNLNDNPNQLKIN